MLTRAVSTLGIPSGTFQWHRQDTRTKFVGGWVSDRNQEDEEEEITVLGGSKSRSESPQIVSETKDIPEIGVKVTLTKSPPFPCATNRRRNLTGIPDYLPPKTIKDKEDIDSDDVFGPSQ